jgi:L-threonylcarbamoyladenylate synthase
MPDEWPSDLRALVAAAAARLAQGELVAFPTETVYGLGARADDDTAVDRIFAAKGRPSDHPLIVHVAHEQAARCFAAELPPAALGLMQAFWPGPLTVIVPRRPGLGAAAAGQQGSVGLRCPSHPLALALLQQAFALGVAGVAAPSANRFGRVSPTTAQHVRDEFSGVPGLGLWVVDGGPCEVGIESTIIDCTAAVPALLRPGMLDRSAIERVLGQALAAPQAHSPRASGTLEQHYAPRARVRLLDIHALRQAVGQAQAAVGVYSRSLGAPAGWPPGAWVRMPADAAACAQELFAVLRRLDDAGVAEIWVEQAPADLAWEGVRDRLQRAAA